jgi:hypothetical protein
MEESLEMVGMSVLVYTLLGYLVARIEDRASA